jgi:Phospholipase_D-nuclease N-terminal
MSVILGILVLLAAIVWVFTAVDIFRRHYSGWTTFGWLVLILVLPFLGALIYWMLRKPTAEEVEGQRLAEADMRHDSASQPFDSTRTRL